MNASILTEKKNNTQSTIDYNTQGESVSYIGPANNHNDPCANLPQDVMNIILDIVGQQGALNLRAASPACRNPSVA